MQPYPRAWPRPANRISAHTPFVKPLTHKFFQFRQIMWMTIFVAEKYTREGHELGQRGQQKRAQLRTKLTKMPAPERNRR
jgi:hypothetical protein